MMLLCFASNPKNMIGVIATLNDRHVEGSGVDHAIAPDRCPDEIRLGKTQRVWRSL
jgi:hypothetical protein